MDTLLSRTPVSRDRHSNEKVESRAHRPQQGLSDPGILWKRCVWLGSIDLQHWQWLQGAGGTTFFTALIGLLHRWSNCISQSAPWNEERWNSSFPWPLGVSFIRKLSSFVTIAQFQLMLCIWCWNHVSVLFPWSLDFIYLGLSIGFCLMDLMAL